MIRTIAIALAASLIAAPVAWASGPQVPTRRVHTADLNLASADGRAMLERRIRIAARQVCQDGATISFAAERQCIREAIDGTRPKVALLLAAARSEVAMADAKPGQ